LCRGALEARTIRHAVVYGNRVIIFTDVPATVCVQCGELYFAGETVDQMNRFAWLLPDTPGDELSVHFHSLAPAPLTA
jgi:YgiT-type zinc finger domain-containing protein